MNKKLVEAQLLLLVYSEIRQLLVFTLGDCARFPGRYPRQLNDSVTLPGQCHSSQRRRVSRRHGEGGVTHGAR